MLNRNTTQADGSNQVKERSYVELETLLIERISRYLDALPEKEREERLLVPFTPSVPEDEAVKRDLIEHRLNPFGEGADYTDDDLRGELLDQVDYLGLDISQDLPTRELQTALREQLERMTDEERLQAGVYGKPFTQEDVERVKELQVDGFLQTIKEVAYKVSPEKIAAVLQMDDSEGFKEWQERITKDFPTEIQAVREALKLEVLGYRTRDRIKILKSKDLI